MKTMHAQKTPAVNDSRRFDRANMDNYEDFCSRILSKLQSEMMHQKSCSPLPARKGAPSSICFHDRAVLSPLLNEKQMREMAEYKKSAIQLEAKRQIYYKNNLINQIQNILWTSKSPNILDDASDQHATPTKAEQNDGFTIHDTANVTIGEGTEAFIWTSKPPVSPSAESPQAKAKLGDDKQTQDEVKAEEVSLQHLLKKSREFIEKEQGRQGAKIFTSKMADPNLTPSEIPSDATFLDPCQTSSGPPVTPEPNVIIRPHRGRPRPISACSVFFAYPDNPNQPRPQTPNPEKRPSFNPCDGIAWCHPLSGTPNARSEISPVDLEVTSPLFRRRCHTMDSQPPYPNPPRNQERMPRFMAGRTPPRVSPTSPLSFTRESPTSAYLGSHGHLLFEMEGNRVFGLSPVGGEEGCERFSPVGFLGPGDGSSRQEASIGCLSSACLDIPSPSVHTPIYMRGLSHRNRLSQVLTAEQQRALCRLSAIVKGFLTRRLLKTEKVKHLCQTVQDTQEFIHSFGGSQMSEQDFSLHERVRAQLRAALFDIHDIFFTMMPEERLYLLQQDRDLRTERKLREMEKAKTSKDKMILSAATQKSLDRKKQRVGESPGPMRKAQKTKSPPTKRILQSSQGQNALVSGQQLLRRGSYKKSPEERVQHSERLKKQHSLG